MLESISNSLSTIDISLKSVSNVGLNDLIDILIIAYLCYKVMFWIKESRAWALLKGFLIVLAISVFAYFFKLDTVRWLIGNTFNVGLIALIVLFQPELRKALEQLGKGKIISNFSMTNQDEDSSSNRVIEEIIKAVMALAKVGTGALILIEQSVALGDLEKTGIKIDAAISSQLLINIFENKTPLHDGAVIIRSNRIAAATCILPLTDINIDKSLGTRHRAALGASEVSDGLIIVVSEETKDISVAIGGKLHRKLTQEQLKDMLLTTKPVEKKKKGLWKGWHSNGKENS